MKYIVAGFKDFDHITNQIFISSSSKFIPPYFPFVYGGLVNLMMEFFFFIYSLVTSKTKIQLLSCLVLLNTNASNNTTDFGASLQCKLHYIGRYIQSHALNIKKMSEKIKILYSRASFASVPLLFHKVVCNVVI